MRAQLGVAETLPRTPLLGDRLETLAGARQIRAGASAASQSPSRDAPRMSELYIGLMSGTSLDGVDGVLVDFEPPRAAAALACSRTRSAPFAAALRAELLALNARGADELHRGALAANALARESAGVVETLPRARAGQRATGARDRRRTARRCAIGRASSTAPATRSS